VASTPHGDDKLAFPGEADGHSHVAGTRRPDNQRRAAVDHAVPDYASRVVAGIAGAHDLAHESISELAEIPHPRTGG
jgi:hypothetical protein